MKGFFLVMMTISLLIVCLLVVKNLSTEVSLDGKKARIAAIDKAKDAATAVNHRTDEMNRKLRKTLGE